MPARFYTIKQELANLSGRCNIHPICIVFMLTDMGNGIYLLSKYNSHDWYSEYYKLLKVCLIFLSDDSHVTKALVAQLLTLTNRHKEHVKMVGREGNGDSCSVCVLFYCS